MVRSTGGKMFGDEKGVSPVIGVILMVLITIVLAASLMLLLGDFMDPEGSAAPIMSLEIKDAPGTLDVRQIDSIVALTPNSIQGGIVLLEDLRFTISNDRNTWVPVACSQKSGPWEVGTTIMLLENSVDQVSPGVTYVRIYSTTANTKIYESSTVYIK